MSVVNLNIVDVATGAPLPGATVSVNGSPQGSADGNGNYTVTANDTDLIGITNVGYSPYSFQIAYLEGDSQVQLSRINSTLPAVVVTPSSGGSQSNFGLLLIAGIAVVALTSKKSGSVGKISKKQGVAIGLGVLAIGGYMLLKKSSSPQTTATPQIAPAGTPAGASTSLISQGSSILNSLKNLLTGGSSTPGPASFVPVGIQDTSQPAPSVAAQYPTLNPNSGINLPAAETPIENVQPGYDVSTDFSTVDSTDQSMAGLWFKKKIGDVSADTFSAADIVGDTLIANKTVTLYNEPYDGSTAIGTVSAGNAVGVVYSWLDPAPDEGRSVLYWQFQNPDGSFYYTPHAVGLFNISSLVQQGVQTQQQKDIAAATPAWLTSIEGYIPYVIGGVIVIALGKSLIKKEL